MMLVLHDARDAYPGLCGTLHKDSTRDKTSERMAREQILQECTYVQFAQRHCGKQNMAAAPGEDDRG